MSIRSELEKRLGQFAASQAPPIPVALENVKFTKPKDGPYLSIYLLAQQDISRNLSAQTRRYGKAQINVYSPIGSGMAAIESLVEQVKALYPVIPKTGEVSIESPPDSSDPFESDNFMCIPITVSYRVEL